MMASKQLNTLFLADGYKISHHLQYPPGTTTISPTLRVGAASGTRLSSLGCSTYLKSIYVEWWLLRIWFMKLNSLLRNILDHAFSTGLVGNISYQNKGETTSQDMRCAKRNCSAHQKCALYCWEHWPWGAMADQLPGDTAGADLVPHHCGHQ